MTTRDFSSFPTLTTERLTLRQLSMDDQQHILALRSNPEINKYLNRAPSNTIEDAANFINRVNDNIQQNISLYWAITKENSFTGTICLFNFSDETNSCEIGYELLLKFQGQGIMKEAAEKVIDYAFQTLQCKEITAHTHNENRPSINLLTKLHFRDSGNTDSENPDLLIFTLNDVR